VFLDQFVDQATLVDFISMCDVYATPYLNEAQMTSGTLAYSFGIGKAVVSTPYWHARNCWRKGEAFWCHLAILLPSVQRLRRCLRTICGDMLCVGRLLVQSSNDLATTAETTLPYTRRPPADYRAKSPKRRSGPAVSPMPPQMNLTHFRSMCDATGLFQHAIHSVPDRSHGYCVDDNARALLLACALNVPARSVWARS